MNAALALEFHHLRINFCTFVTHVIKFPSWKPKPYFAFHSTGRVVVNTLTDERWAPQVCTTNSTDVKNVGIFAIPLKVVFPIFSWREHFLLTVQRVRGRLTEMLFGVITHVGSRWDLDTEGVCDTCSLEAFPWGSRALTSCHSSPSGMPPLHCWGGYYLCGGTQASGRSESANSFYSSVEFHVLFQHWILDFDADAVWSTVPVFNKDLSFLNTSFLKHLPFSFNNLPAFATVGARRHVRLTASVRDPCREKMWSRPSPDEVISIILTSVGSKWRSTSNEWNVIA